MKKTVTVNLNQIVFHIEEDAYDKLNKYLDSLRRHFAKSDDADEIVTDIESRAAEIFSDSLKGRSVITLADVSSFINSMGSVADLDDSDPDPDPKTNTPPAKKFYRDPDHQIIGGVAAGLAAYFGLDPVIVRLLFVLSLLLNIFGGFGLILYLILWIILPPAQTSAQKLEMRGDPVTLENIQETVKGGVATLSKPESPLAAALLLPFRLIGRVLTITGQLLKEIFPILLKFTGFSLILSAALGLAGLVLAATFVTFGFGSVVDTFPFPELLFTTPYYLLAGSLFFIAFVPLVFVIQLGSVLLRGASRFSWLSALTSFIVWIAAIGIFGSTLISLAPKYGPQVREWIESNTDTYYLPSTVNMANSRTVDISGFTQISNAHASQVLVNLGGDYRVEIFGDDRYLDRLQLEVDNGQLTIQDRGYSADCPFCHPRQLPVKVEITLPSLTGFNASGRTHNDITALNQDSFNLEQSGATRVTLRGSVNNLEASLSGASRLNSLGLNNANAAIQASGASVINLAVRDSLSANLSGASRLYYLGTPVLKPRTSGASIIEPISPQQYNLEVEDGVVITPSPLPYPSLTPTGTQL